MSAIDQGRYTVAAGAVGLAQACLDASVRYAHERQTFGEEIGRAPARQADDRQHGQGHRDRAGCSSGGPAGSRTSGVRNTRETSLAKWHATEHAVQAALDAIQIHGANGYSQRVPGRALPAQLEGGRHLRGHEPAAHADPGRLRPRLSRGPADPLRAVAGPGLRAPRRPLPARADRSAATRRGRTRAGACATGPTPSCATLATVAETFVRGDAVRARLAADGARPRPRIRPRSASSGCPPAHGVAGRQPRPGRPPDRRSRRCRSRPASATCSAGAARGSPLRRSAFQAFAQAAELPRLRRPGWRRPEPAARRRSATSADRAAGHRRPRARSCRCASPVRPGPDDDGRVALDADVVVVGSGAGGGVVAAELGPAGPLGGRARGRAVRRRVRRCRPTSSTRSTGCTWTTACLDLGRLGDDPRRAARSVAARWSTG